MKHFLFKCQRLKNFITKTNFDSAELVMVLLANPGGLRWSWLSLDSKFLWAKHTQNHNRPLIFSWDHQISFEKWHGIVGIFLFTSNFDPDHFTDSKIKSNIFQKNYLQIFFHPNCYGAPPKQHPFILFRFRSAIPALLLSCKPYH